MNIVSGWSYLQWRIQHVMKRDRWPLDNKCIEFLLMEQKRWKFTLHKQKGTGTALSCTTWLLWIAKIILVKQWGIFIIDNLDLTEFQSKQLWPQMKITFLTTNKVSSGPIPFYLRPTVFSSSSSAVICTNSKTHSEQKTRLISTAWLQWASRLLPFAASSSIRSTMPRTDKDL